MKKSATIYLPNGDVENFETGEHGDVDNICLFNNGSIQIAYKGGSETIYANMPFIYEDAKRGNQS